MRMGQFRAYNCAVKRADGGSVPASSTVKRSTGKSPAALIPNRKKPLNVSW
jgi:hypothetical protein